MDSPYTCPHCERPILADDALPGRVVQCAGCKKIIELPKARRTNSHQSTWWWISGLILGATAVAIGVCLTVRHVDRKDAGGKTNASVPAASSATNPAAPQPRSFATDPEALVPMIEERLITDWMDDLDLKNEAEVRHRARDVLAQKAQVYTPDFIRVFENHGNKDRLRGNAILAMGFTGSKTGPELEAAVRALKDGDQYVRCCAMESLRKLRMDQKRLVPMLAEMLNDPVSNVRRMAAINLGYAGVAAQGTLPALQQLTSDEAPTTRAAAAEAIQTINQKLAAPSRPKN